MAHALVIFAGFVIIITIPVVVLCITWAFWLRRSGRLTEVSLILFGAIAAFFVSLAIFIYSMSDISALAIDGTQLVENGRLTLHGYVSCLLRALLSTIIGVFVAQVCWRIFSRKVA